MSKKITSDLKEQIIHEYLNCPTTISNIAKQFNLSNPTICKILACVPKYKKAQIFNPELNETAFSVIDNELSAYFLGLIIADGNIFLPHDGNRQASISISLQKSDGYILEEFKKFMKTNTSVVIDNRGCCQIAIRSNKVADDLKNLGVLPQKSFNTTLPNIPKDQMSHLIRGIIDGDGSIFALKHNNKFLHSISCCGTHTLMQNMSDAISETLNISTKPKVYDYKNRILSEFKIYNFGDTLKLGNWIYKNATIYLKRKREMFEQIKKYHMEISR